MYELVPIILGALWGTVICLTTNGKTRFALSLVVVAVSGTVATVVSGEYLESWIYVLQDFSEAALGLIVGYLVAAGLHLLLSGGPGDAPHRGTRPVFPAEIQRRP